MTPFKNTVIDVRDPCKDADILVFAEGRSGNDFTRVARQGSAVAFVTKAGDHAGYLAQEDIDNLIKALQEAKRWGEPYGSTL
jgi:hypothetical protein